MKNTQLLPPLILFVLALVWGSSFVLMKEGMTYYTWWEVAGYRMLISALFLAPFLIHRLKTVRKKDLKYFFGVGFFGNFLPAFLFTLAETRISSALAGALNALTPLFTLIIGMIFLGVKNDKTKMAGVFVGLMGAVLLLLFKPGGEIDGNFSYNAIIILATLCYGISVNIIKSKLGDYKALTTAAVPLGMMCIPGATIFFVSLWFRDTPILIDDSLKAFAAMNILGIVGTALSLVLFNRLIQMTSAVFASSVTYLIPIVAMVWGVIYGEEVGWIQWIGLVIILAGITLLNQSRKKNNPLVRNVRTQ